MHLSMRVSFAVLLAGGLAACGPSAFVKPPDTAAPQATAASRITPPSGVQLETTCTSTGVELCYDAIDNNCNGLIDEGCGINTGVVQVTLAWQEADANLDLVVTDPTGEDAKIPPATPTQGGLVKEQDCPGTDHPCHGQNLENVYMISDVEPIRGTYHVTVVLSQTNGASLPIKAHLSARIGDKVYGMTLLLHAEGEKSTMSFVL